MTRTLSKPVLVWNWKRGRAMWKRKLLFTLTVLLCCLLMLSLSGCLPWSKLIEQLKSDNGSPLQDIEEEVEPDRVDETEADSENGVVQDNGTETVETADLNEPYHAQEFGLESLGLSKNMTPEEVIAILGDPLSVDFHDGMGPHTTFNYDRLSLSFEQGLQYYKLQDPAITAARGIRVGDPVEKVLNSYLLENEHPDIWTNPDAESWYEPSDRCIELYYLEPDDEGLVKTGIVYCDRETGDPFKITYSHFLPYTCGYSGITYYIENDLVTEINRAGY